MEGVDIQRGIYVRDFDHHGNPRLAVSFHGGRAVPVSDYESLGVVYDHRYDLGAKQFVARTRREIDQHARDLGAHAIIDLEQLEVPGEESRRWREEYRGQFLLLRRKDSNGAA